MSWECGLRAIAPFHNTQLLECESQFHVVGLLEELLHRLHRRGRVRLPPNIDRGASRWRNKCKQSHTKVSNMQSLHTFTAVPFAVQTAARCREIYRERWRFFLQEKVKGTCMTPVHHCTRGCLHGRKTPCIVQASLGVSSMGLVWRREPEGRTWRAQSPTSQEDFARLRSFVLFSCIPWTD